MLDRSQISALVAVVREGSFEAAARVNHVTASAISQRIKQLEDRVGGILVVRSTPCRATALGEALYRHGLQIELLEKDVLTQLDPSGVAEPPTTPISIAVNADSLATWISPALTAYVEQTGFRVEVVVDDQDHTTTWLRSGRVLGAVTADARPVQGCRVQSLGIMRYRANASPAFNKSFFPKGFGVRAFSAARVIAYDRKDQLHEKFVSEVCGWKEGVTMLPHFLPSPTAIVDACINGLGWALHPELLVLDQIKAGTLRDVIKGRWLDVPLYWQQWTLESHALNTLAAVLRAQAGRSLRPG